MCYTFFLYLLLFYTRALTLTGRPIIGILSTPTLDIDYGEAGIPHSHELGIPEGYTHSIPTHYIQWLNGAGARVVPIFYNATQEEIDFLLSRVNGVLFTGGDLSLRSETTYFKTAAYIYNKLKEMNDIEENIIPLWGICMGLQLISIIQADNQQVLSRGKFHTHSTNLPLYFTKDYKNSKIFERIPDFVLNILKNSPSTVNLHRDGIEPAHFFSMPKISNFFNILAYNYDSSTVPFVSVMEAYHYPFYAVQFHPERPAFDFGILPITLEPITHTFKAIIAGDYFANFFVNQAKKNDHHFRKSDASISKFHHQFDATPEDPFLINNYMTIFLGNSIESYWFH